MRVRIELEDGTIVTIERPGRGRVGIRSIVTQDSQGDATTESPWVIQAHAPGETEENFAPLGEDEATDAGPALGSGGEAAAEAVSAPGGEAGFQALEGGATASDEEEEVIDAGPAPGAGSRQEVVFSQRAESPTTPEPQKKRRRKKS